MAQRGGRIHDSGEDSGAHPIVATDAWKARLRAAIDIHDSPATFAAALGIDGNTLRSWVGRTHAPSLGYLRLLEEKAAYPLSEQLLDLELVPANALPWAPDAWTPAPANVMSQLRHLMQETARLQPSVMDVANIVIGGDPREHQSNDARVRSAWMGRWRARVFDVPTGDRYPHIAFHGVEFQLGVAEDGTNHVAWTNADWSRLQLDGPPFEWAEGLWSERLLRDGATLIDSWDDRVITEAEAQQRIELVWRLRRASALSPFLWYGAFGGLYRSLLYTRASTKVRHIGLLPAYGNYRSDPSEARELAWLQEKQIDRLLIVTKASGLGRPTAGVLAETIGWQHWAVRDLVNQMTGRASPTTEQERVHRLRRVMRLLGEESLGQTHVVISMQESDAIADEDGNLWPEVQAALSRAGTFVVFIVPTEASSRAWLERQVDQVDQDGSDAMLRRQDESSQGLERAIQLARASSEIRSLVLEWRKDIDWWPAAEDETDLRPFWHPSIGDQVVRAAYSLAYRLHTGRLPPPGTRRVVPMVADSLLRRFRQKLTKDPEVQVFRAQTQ